MQNEILALATQIEDQINSTSKAEKPPPSAIVDILNELTIQKEKYEGFIEKYFFKYYYEKNQTIVYIRIAFLWLTLDESSKVYKKLRSIAKKNYKSRAWVLSPYVDEEDIFLTLIIKVWSLSLKFYSKDGVNLSSIHKIAKCISIDYIRKYTKAGKLISVDNPHTDCRLVQDVQNNPRMEAVEEIYQVIEKIKKEQNIPNWLMELSLKSIQGLSDDKVILQEINSHRKKKNIDSWSMSAFKSFLYRLRKNIQHRIQ